MVYEGWTAIAQVLEDVADREGTESRIEELSRVYIKRILVTLSHK